MLNVKQLELIEALLSYPSATYRELAEMVKINKNTITAWKRLPEFQQELKSRMKENWAESEKIAQKTMIELAAKGDFKASKYILDNFGYAPTQKIDAVVSNDINLVIGE